MAEQHGFTVRRIFDAPRERVWKEWTEPERFADWFGGPQSEVPLSTVSMDVSPGGAWRLTMYAEPGRREIHWWGEYREVAEPERLVFTVCDRPGSEPRDRPSSEPHDRPGDAYELVTVEFTDLGDGRTEMLLEQRGSMSPEQYERAKEGWGGFFDRIAERLAS
jgi:uncharacterized protein YndB with AHSA1/START domain